MTRRSNIALGLFLLAVVGGGFMLLIWYLICPNCVRPVFGIPTALPTSTPTPAPTATPTPPPVAQLYVYGGYRYFLDPQINLLLKDRYRIVVKGEAKKGTYDMADSYDPAKQPVDCIFPGSKTGVEYFEEKHPKVIHSSTVAAQDRIMLFTWKELLPTLQSAGLVYAKDNSYYIRMKPLVDTMMAEQKWRDVSVDIPGYVRVEFTEPLTSSSGMQWMAFVGTYLVPGKESGGSILTMEDLQADPAMLEKLYRYWENQGQQVGTTAQLFAKFVSSGENIPMIVAYESSYTDWYSPLPPDQKELASAIVGVYPEFTINIEHTLASLSPACDPLLSAINDPQIQELAWRNHGLYPQGFIPPSCAPGATWCGLKVPYVPEPRKVVTDEIKAALNCDPEGGFSFCP